MNERVVAHSDVQGDNIFIRHNPSTQETCEHEKGKSRKCNSKARVKGKNMPTNVRHEIGTNVKK
jgi:hypothetical protein